MAKTPKEEAAEKLCDVGRQAEQAIGATWCEYVRAIENDIRLNEDGEGVAVVQAILTTELETSARQVADAAVQKIESVFGRFSE